MLSASRAVQGLCPGKRLCVSGSVVKVVEVVDSEITASKERAALNCNNAQMIRNDGVWYRAQDKERLAVQVTGTRW